MEGGGWELEGAEGSEVGLVKLGWRRLGGWR